jgi:glycine cleavage system H protein
MELVKFKHARFVAHFPREYFYTKSHYWLSMEDGNARVRVGFSQFATRMLGELVECEWKKKQGEKIEVGEVIGWGEGFKAAADIYSVIEGFFLSGNAKLEEDACVVKQSPYRDGWLYEASGEMEEEVMNVDAYIEYLNLVLEKMASQYDAKELESFEQEAEEE